MRTLLQLPTGILFAALIGLPPAHAQSPEPLRLGQVAAPPEKGAAPAAPPTLRKVSPPRSTEPAPSTPAAKGSTPVQAKSTIPTLEQENKNLKQRIAEQDLVILNLTARLERTEKASALVAARAKELSDQIAAMTKPGGSLVRAYCESDEVSRNTAGAVTRCNSMGYACEPVSGLCYTRCSRTTQCAVGWVCDIPVSNCVRPN